MARLVLECGEELNEVLSISSGGHRLICSAFLLKYFFTLNFFPPRNLETIFVLC